MLVGGVAQVLARVAPADSLGELERVALGHDLAGPGPVEAGAGGALGLAQHGLQHLALLHLHSLLGDAHIVRRIYTDKCIISEIKLPTTHIEH